MRMAWVQVSKDTSTVIRIFKNQRTAFSAVDTEPTWMPYGIAVASIRHQLFIRSQGLCENCCAIVTEKSGHMHEKKWRGKGGEISMDNSVFICPRCHQFEHKDRAPKFTRRKP
jgi:hypothetical protein